MATETSRFVRAVEGLPARIVDTRKTVPGLRSLQKYAVRVGGGSNHRRSLGDGVLIKDIATRDGGATWQVVREAKALFDLDFIDLSNGWAVGTLGLVLRTTSRRSGTRGSGSPRPCAARERATLSG